MKKVFLIITALTMSACATATKSTLLGMGVGVATGALLGAGVNSSDPQRGSTTGAAVGAGLGGLLGYLAYQGEEKKKARMMSVPAGITSEVNFTPSVSQPVIKRVFIEDKIEDGKYIEGHSVWILDQPAQWRKTR